MGEYAETLSRFVTSLAAGDPLVELPVARRTEAAVLFADISGFTALSERLAERGPAGAEELTGLLNRYFGEMVALIDEHGGEVVKFAGDALLAVWLAHETGLDDPTRRAARCALAVESALDDREVLPGTRLRLRIGVGCGTVLVAEVGGVSGRRELVVAGDPLVQIAVAEHAADPGEAVASPEAWARLEDSAQGTPTADGCVRLDAMSPGDDDDGVQSGDDDPAGRRPVPPAPERLEPFVPVPILARLAAGQSEWLAELRRVSVVFVNIRGIDYRASDAAAGLQGAMTALQAVLARQGGSVNKLIIDDKGTSLLAVFGLPTLSHEDDPVRAVNAALAMCAALGAQGLTAAAGVTTGRCFCGPVGGELRREYTVIGDVVNLAARLMQNAGAGVLVDAATSRFAQSRLAFEALAPLRVKGKVQPVGVFRPSGERAVPTGRGAAQAGAAPFVGRRAERTHLIACIEALAAGRGSVVLVEGEAGIGKSRLAEEMLAAAEGRGMRVLRGKADAVERGSPYHAWRAVFSDALALTDDDVSTRRAQVLDRLAPHPELAALAPLLEPILGLGLSDNELTANLVGPTRAERTVELLLGVLRAAASEGRPLVVGLEDGHWFDSASWALAGAVASEMAETLLLVVTRPLDDPRPPELDSLRKRAAGHHLELGALSESDTAALIAGTLQAETLPAALPGLVHTRTQGNPFFTEEVARALRDQGVLTLDGRTCRVSEDVDLSAVEVPDTVQGVVTTRIDGLPPSEQLTLKTASVVGREFPLEAVSAIFPMHDQRARLPSYLDRLHRLELTPRIPSAESSYLFKHIITREVAYGLMLFAQRKALHAAAAQWYEQTRADEVGQHLALLAHHWDRAENIPKAIEYAERAGALALRSDANREAIALVGRARELATAHPEAAEVSGLRRGRWERQLGEAHFALGDMASAKQHLYAALGALGLMRPGDGQNHRKVFLVAASRQLLHRLAPGRLIRASGEERDRLQEAARIGMRISQAFYYGNDMPSTVTAGVITLNFAERVGPCPELARAFAAMCIAAGLVPLHSLAGLYFRRARETAEAIDDVSARAYVLFATSLYGIGVGRWEEVGRALEEAGTLFERLGDRREWGKCKSALGMAACYQERFDEARAHFVELREAAAKSNDVQQHTWGLWGEAAVLIRDSQWTDAMDRVEEATALIEGTHDHSARLVCDGLRALVHVYEERFDEAEEAAERVMSVIETARPTVYSTIEAYTGAVHTFIELASRGEARALPRAARATEALRSYARVFPIGKPVLLVAQGRLERLAGREARARRALQQSVRVAEELGMHRHAEFARALLRPS